MRYFIDTNILIDLVTNRKPFGNAAVSLFQKSKSKKWTFYTSAISITTTHYILLKTMNNAEATAVISKLLPLLKVIPADHDILSRAAKSLFNDFEDAVQFECAVSVKGIDGIITRNLKDFKHSTIPVLAPEEVLI